MNAADLRMSWRTFDLGLEWTAIVDSRHGLMELRAYAERVGKRDVARHELLDVCAATELGRLDAGLLARVYDAARRGRGRGRPMPWRELLDGATGYRREDAPGDLSIGEVLERLGLVLVRIDTPGVDDAERRAA